MTKIMFIGNKVKIYTGKYTWFTIPYSVYKEMWK